MKKLLLALLLSATSVSAETYFVAPPTVVTENLGTLAQPFNSIQSAVNSGKLVAKDILMLKNGDYGNVTIANAKDIVIRSRNFSRAHLDSLVIKDSSNLIVKNLTIYPTDPVVKRAQQLVTTTSTTTKITLLNLTIKGQKDTSGWALYTPAYWQSISSDGVYLLGSYNTIQKSSLEVVRLGILVDSNSSAINNTINAFANDGMRANGDNSQLIGNTVTNCIAQGDGNHADGFQSFASSINPTIDNLTISRNKFIRGSAHALACDFQGIGMFDGPYTNIIIENNIVQTNNGHGITVLGPNNVRIVNNSVLQTTPSLNNWPWITVGKSKTGIEPVNTLLQNNLARDFAPVHPQVTQISNKKVNNDYFNADFSPKVCDQGSAPFPPTDINNKPRTLPCLGAIEN